MPYHVFSKRFVRKLLIASLLTGTIIGPLEVGLNPIGGVEVANAASSQTVADLYNSYLTDSQKAVIYEAMDKMAKFNADQWKQLLGTTVLNNVEQKLSPTKVPDIAKDVVSLFDSQGNLSNVELDKFRSKYPGLFGKFFGNSTVFTNNKSKLLGSIAQKIAGKQNLDDIVKALVDAIKEVPAIDAALSSAIGVGADAFLQINQRFKDIVNPPGGDVTPPSGGGVTPPSNGGGSIPGGNFPGTNRPTEVFTPPADTTKSETIQGPLGESVVKAVVDKQKLEDFIDNQISASPGKTNVVVVEVKGQGEQVETELNVSTFVKLAAKDTTALIEIKSELGSLAVPAGDLKQAVEQLGLSLANAKVTVKLTKVDSSTEQVVNIKANEAGAQSLVTPIDFTIEVTSESGAIQTISSFTSFVPRSIPLPVTSNSVDSRYLAGVMFNPDTLEFYPVPTIITTVDGRKVATLYRKGTSVYTIIKNQKSFTDVPADHYAKANIETLASKFVISGYEDGTFGPYRQVTRAEFATLLIRGLGIVPEKNASTTFSDVKSGDWYAGNVAAAVKAGLISGYEDGTFRPNQQISRQEMVKMIYNALNSTGHKVTLTEAEKASLLNRFSDKDQIPAWAADATAAAVKDGIVNGVGDGLFSPETQADRAQSATILYRMMKSVGLIN